MASPSSTSFQRPDLGRSFEEYGLRASWAGFVAQQVMPPMPVGLQKASFSKIPIEALLMTRDTARAPGGGYARQDWDFEQDSYDCKEHGAEEVIDDGERAIYAYTIDVEQIGADRTYDAVARNLEIRVADAIFNASTWTGASLTTAVTTEWSNKASATPIADVKAAIQKVWDNSGLTGLSMVVNRKVFENLRVCDEIVNLVKYWGGDDPKQGSISAKLIATALGLENVIVANGVKNTAQKGQTASLSPIWSSEYAMIFKPVQSQDLKEPGLGRIFDFVADGSSVSGAVEMYREERVRGDVVRVRHWTDEKVLYVQAGHLLSNITA